MAIKLRPRRYLTSSLLILFVGIVIIFVYAQALPQVYPLEVGMVSKYDVVATGDVEDKAATEAKAKEQAALVAMVMGRSENISSSCLKNLNDFFTVVDQVRADIYSKARTSNDEDTEEDKSAGNRVVYQLSDDNINAGVTELINRLQKEMGVKLDKTSARILIVNERSIYESIKAKANSFADIIMQGKNDSAEIEAQISRKVDNLKQSVQYFSDSYNVIETILKLFLKPNVIYDEDATVKAREAAYNQVEQNPVMVLKGTRIVSVGDTVTQNQYDQMKALNLIYTGKINFTFLIGIIVLVILCTLAGVLFLYYFERERLKRPNDRFITMVIVLIPLLLAGWATKTFPTASPVYIATILLTIYFDLRTAIILTQFINIMMFPISPAGAQFLFVSTAGAMISGVITELFAKRSRFAYIILGTGIGVGLAAFAYDLIIKATLQTTGTDAGIAMISGGMAAVAAIGISPLVEAVLSSVSPMKLVELSQPNHPLLRKLFLDAPGTYQHCMMVANLAESAADAVGVDTLLVRVGAYYHDIGKTVNPLMFTENQTDENPHDKMDPEKSVEVIVKHVENGLEIARKNRLPIAVQKIIEEHHGNQLQAYFYDKAKRMAQEQGKSEPDPERFKYPFHVPTCKESAIVMMADSCEAAMKSQGISDMKGAEELIRRIVKGKMNTDQFIDSGLSFEEVENCIQAFMHTFEGQFHKRVRYPGDKPDPEQSK